MNMTKKSYKRNMAQGNAKMSTIQAAKGSRFAFGKYKNENVWSVATKDPEYVLWCLDTLWWFDKHLEKVAPGLPAIIRYAKKRFSEREDQWVISPRNKPPKFPETFLEVVVAFKKARS